VPVRALLLDFDGVICDTERAARRSWQELYEELGLRFPPPLWRKMIGRPEGESEALADLAARLGWSLDAASRARRRRRKAALAAQEPLRPGVAELTATAVTRGLSLAIVSSSPSAWIHEHLVRLGVSDRFDVIVTGDEVTHPKPAADPYQLALARLGLSCDEAVAFEDSPPGIQAARAAGVRSVAVPSSVADPADLRAADLVLENVLAYRLPTATVDPNQEGVIG
jgi:HAD superfamily hydrolase (TIGR01509 family)